MNSISKLAKNHCHNIANIICGVLLTILAILAIIQSCFVINVYCIANAVIVTLISTSVWLHISGLKIGCKLVRIPLIIFTLFFFFLFILICAIGFVLLFNNGAEEYIRFVFEKYNYTADFSTTAISLIVIAAGLILFALSFCILAGVRFFGSIENCLSGKIKRSGAKIFSISSFALSILLAIFVIVYTAVLVSKNHFMNMLALFPQEMLFIRMVLVDILLVFMGISAGSFSNKTYAYKVFENQMMKVESNADGIVYVPINEEDEETFCQHEIQPGTSEKIIAERAELDRNGKPFIKTGMLSVPTTDVVKNNIVTDETQII